jgi:hypothetical protein
MLITITTDGGFTGRSHWFRGAPRNPPELLRHDRRKASGAKLRNLAQTVKTLEAFWQRETT